APPPAAAPPAAAAPVAPPAAAAPVEAPPPPPPMPSAFGSEVPPPAPPESGMLGNDGYPLAGYHGGLFFLRSPDDDFRLYVQGRAQIDMYNYFGPGVPDTALKSTLFLRRIRPELTGEFLKTISFQLAGDWGATALDNTKGNTETSAAAPGAAPSATSGRF